MDWLLSIKWGAKSLIALYLSVISGIIVSLQYNPNEPYYSSGTLEVIVPFGSFWRSLHFYSSQFFVVLLLVHLAMVILERRRKIFKSADNPQFSFIEDSSDLSFKKSGKVGWIKLTLSAPVAVLLLFTGYILRADATGESAGVIAENITLSLPVAGKWLNALLFNISAAGMQVVYANHLVGLGVLWGVLSWAHLRKYRISLRDQTLTTVVILLISMLVSAPFEPFQPGSFLISGPWFFVGVQEMLRYIQPFWAGIFFPLAGVVLLCQLVTEPAPGKKVLGYFLLWSLVYTVLTVAGLLR